jgi:hypothetical protein
MVQSMHITQGVVAVLAMGPGMFIPSMLYGTLARRMGTILPGIVIHALGDLARVYFGALRGDGSLLFVNWKIGLWLRFAV